MMPDLGKYSGTVLSAYAVGLALLALIVVISLWQSRRMQRRLEQAEKRRKEA